MKTKECLHNLHFGTIGIFSPKWKKRKVKSRQIIYDGPRSPDTYFIIDPKTLELYVFFESFGSQANPRILKIDTVSEDYFQALWQIFLAEHAILSMMFYKSYGELKDIDTEAKLKKQLKLYIKEKG